MSQFIISSCNPSEILETTESILYETPLSVPLFVADYQSFTVGSPGYDWASTESTKRITKRGRVLPFIGNNVPGILQIIYQQLYRTNVAYIARRQPKSEGTTYYVGEYMELTRLATP